MSAVVTKPTLVLNFALSFCVGGQHKTDDVIPKRNQCTNSLNCIYFPRKWTWQLSCLHQIFIVLVSAIMCSTRLEQQETKRKMCNVFVAFRRHDSSERDANMPTGITQNSSEICLGKIQSNKQN